MLVKDLIEKLKDAPPEAVVLVLKTRKSGLYYAGAKKAEAVETIGIIKGRVVLDSYNFVPCRRVASERASRLLENNPPLQAGTEEFDKALREMNENSISAFYIE